jgi:hypothetical protein
MSNVTLFNGHNGGQARKTITGFKQKILASGVVVHHFFKSNAGKLKAVTSLQDILVIVALNVVYRG